MNDSGHRTPKEVFEDHLSFGLGLDHDLRLPSLLDAVTLEDVNAAARQTLDVSRAALVVAGPYQR